MRMQARRLKSWEEARELLKYGATVWLNNPAHPNLKNQAYNGWAVFRGHWPQGDGLYFELPNGRRVSAGYENVYVKPI
jgi:hypothetical protein